MRAVFPARDCGSNHLDTSPSGIKNCFPAVPSPPGLLRGNFNVLLNENFFTIFVECEIREIGRVYIFINIYLVYLGRRESKDSFFVPLFQDNFFYLSQLE